MSVRLKAAPAVIAIAALTVLVSLLIMAAGWDLQAAIRGGFIPARASLGFGGDVPGLVPVILTPLSASLVHGGLLHLATNMVMLIYVGIATERALGSKGLLLLYIVGAYAAAAGQWIVDPSSAVPMVGASGAASGVVGAYALLFGRPRTRDIGPIPAWPLHVAWLLAAWIAINWVMGLVAAQSGYGIAVAAHVGGFIAGLALCRPLLLWKWRNA